MSAMSTVHSILIVEDEKLLAMMLEDLLLDAGYHVERAFGLEDAMAIVARERVDAAILDINLNGKNVFPLAERLRDGRIPFVFASACNQSVIVPEFKHYPMLPKPYRIDQVQQLLDQLLPSRARAANL